MATQINVEFETAVQQLDRWLARDREYPIPRFPERTYYAPPSEVIGSLLRHRVRFILFGGLAAMFHGWPGPTSDVDIMPDLRKDNRLALWRAAQDVIGKRLEEVGAEGKPPPQPLEVRDVRDFGLGVVFNPFYPEVGGYFELLRSSVPCTISSGTFHVASLENVIKSMSIAARPKDQEKLPELTYLLQLTRTAGGC